MHYRQRGHTGLLECLLYETCNFCSFMYVCKEKASHWHRVVNNALETSVSI